MSSAHVPLRSAVDLPEKNPYTGDADKQDEKFKQLDANPLEVDDEVEDAPTSDRSKEVQEGAQDQQEYNKRRLRKYAKKGLAMGIASAIGHFLPGSSGAMNAFALFATHLHIQRLRAIRQKACSKGNQCHKALDFIIAQKVSKRQDAGVKMVPVVGQVVGLAGKVKNLYKRYKRTAGVAREANATLLVDHARSGCTVAAAGFIEIVFGDYRTQANWDKALELLPSAYATDAAKDKMSKTA